MSAAPTPPAAIGREQHPPLSRRQVLFAGALAPLLASCATNLGRFSEASIPDLATQLGVCAVSYAVLDAGKPQPAVHLSGCAPAQGAGPAGASVFQAASLTKPVVAFAALQLVRDGQLDLDSPVARYLPDGYVHRQHPFAGPGDRRIDVVPAATLARIPVASLLTHSAGLPNWTSGTLAPEFEAGSRWQYSGEGYVLLQAVLAAVSGQDFESFMTRSVFEPLGMRHTHLRWSEALRPLFVPGTSRFGGASQFDFVEPNAAASLYTTADDYATLMAALLADAALLSRTLERPVSADAELGLSWGRGWGIEDAAGGPYLWQWGNNPGFRAFAIVSASTGKGYVLLTNSERGMPLAAPLARTTIPAEHGVFRFHMLG